MTHLAARRVTFALLTLAATALTAAPRLAAAGPSLCDAVMGNLVANCGFETGSLGAWINANPAPGGGPAFVLPAVPNSGTYAAKFIQIGGFGIPSGYGAISQTLTTTPGQAYAISFYGLNFGGADRQNGIRLLFDGTTVFDQALGSGYQQFTTTGVATGTSTTFTVQGYNNPSASYIDDFVVIARGTVAPEPGTWALLAMGLLGVAGVSARRKVDIG